MKKIALLAFSAVAAFGLTSCDLIDNIFDKEVEYSFADYKAMLAERDFKAHEYKTATFESKTKVSDSEETKDSMVFTWSSNLSTWTPDADHPTATIETCVLSAWTVTDQVKGITESNAKYYKFFARKKAYRILVSTTDDTMKMDIEWKYNELGYITECVGKAVNLEELTSSNFNATIKYAK